MVTSRMIDIKSDDGQSFKGYLALPPAGKGPGIVLIQEIFGVNSHIRAVADQYALDGFVVLAPDVFWRIEPGVELGYSQEDIQKGMQFKQKLDYPRTVQDLACTVNALRGLPECTGKVASIGYCMGGTLSYLCAAGAGVDAAVCYYPGGIEKQLGDAGGIRCPILFNFAANDRSIPMDAVDAVKAAFAGRDDVQVEIYPGVEHGFNCWARAAYDQKSAALARARSLTLLAQAIGA